MRALPGCLSDYRARETIGEPGRQWITAEAVSIDAADESRDAIAHHRPVNHAFG